MQNNPLRPARQHPQLSLEQLRWFCPQESIPAETTEGVEPIEGIIGQDRALKALKLGVELYSPGYNVFVCGLSGTGKATTIKTILEKIQPRKVLTQDYCYVHNFEDPDRPMLLVFERGQGRRFQTDMAEAMQMVLERIPGQFEEEEVLKKKQSLIDEYNRMEAELFAAFEKELEPEGFVLGRVQDGQTLHPEILIKLGEKAVLVSDLPAAVTEKLLAREEAEKYTEKYRVYKRKLQDVFRQGMKLSREYQKKIADHERQVGEFYVGAIFTDLLNDFTDEKAQTYLRSVIESLLENLDQFKVRQEEAIDVPTEYQVNLLLDNSTTSCCPVVIETAPTFRNIFGTLERSQDANGFYFTDFTMIKAGSLLQADGGFLVLNAADALTEAGVWKNLQRVLLYRKLEIQSLEMFSQQSGSAMKPEGIEVNVKVILIGNNEIYGALSAYERDFKKIFKVKADFDYEMPNTELAVKQYTALIRKMISDEGMKHFDKRAIAGIVEYGARLVNSKKKLTTQFSEIADIVREANYWCEQNSNKYVTAEHVDKAIDETYSRHALYEDKLQEMIDNEVILIDVVGERIGQINGLAVYGGERFSFGKPTRITATAAAGKAGIINIEREANMSGSTHDKGMLILSGFIREQFAQERPMSLTASISFEQSYSGIDGDSASSTEVYALLSALSDLPIKQAIAVTGSINQKGDIQPIGGVNEKIEGFFDVCERRGLTGNQGVIIPKQNVEDLMLRSNIVESVRSGRFHIWAVANVQEGIELLTGVAAGEREESGHYPPDTVFGLVERRLQRLYQNAQDGGDVEHDLK
ncbi:MAG: AAA family ATPase [Bacteroidetes bacterium]|nr:AAA family ATPase [Bacteroidota bacterium]